MTFLEAVAKYEGWQASPTNRPTRNNNPGNVEWGPFAQSHGATRLEVIPQGYTSTARYAEFPDPDTGFGCMRALFLKRYAGMTVEATMHKYAPPVENDTRAYVNYICQKCGCTPATMVDELLL